TATLFPHALDSTRALYATRGQTCAPPILPGTVNTGNSCDDCVTNITLPFPVSFYGQTFTTANLGSNGNLQFVGTNLSYVNTCLRSEERRVGKECNCEWSRYHYTSSGGCTP